MDSLNIFFWQLMKKIIIVSLSHIKIEIEKQNCLINNVLRYLSENFLCIVM